jgi:hypothetical protein
MRWLFSFSVVLAMFQVAGCRSDSKNPQRTSDAAVPLETGGSSGIRTIVGSGADASEGGGTGSADAAKPSDVGGGTSSSSSSGTGGSSGGIRTADALSTVQGGSAVDAARDGSPLTGGGVDGAGGAKGGSGGTIRTSSSVSDAGIVTTGGTVGIDAGGDGTNSSPGTCASDSVCIVGGQVRGLFSGSGWVDMGLNDSLTDPTCGVDKHAITTENACASQFNWNSETALCMTGSVSGLPGTASDAEYDASWGVEIGIGGRDQSEAIGTALAKYSMVTFFFTGPPTVWTRATLHRKGDPKTKTYCIDSVKSGRALYLARFNTKCWGDVTTVVLQPEDYPKIDYFALRSPPLQETSTVDNLCLTGLSFQ